VASTSVVSSGKPPVRNQSSHATVTAVTAAVWITITMPVTVFHPTLAWLPNRRNSPRLSGLSILPNSLHVSRPGTNCTLLCVGSESAPAVCDGATRPPPPIGATVSGVSPMSPSFRNWSTRSFWRVSVPVARLPSAFSRNGVMSFGRMAFTNPSVLSAGSVPGSTAGSKVEQMK
jgi:hypothetical protein